MDQRLLANHNDYLTQKLPIFLLACLASGVPLYLASLTVLRHRFVKPPSVLVSCLVWLLSDLALTETAAVLLGKANLRNDRIGLPIATLIHGVGSVVTGATIMFAVCLFFLGRDRTVALSESIAHQNELLANADAYRASIRTTYSEQIRLSVLPGFERIKQEVEALAKSRKSSPKFKNFAERVREFSITEVRNLSHAIALSAVLPIESASQKVTQVVERSRLSAAVLRPANPFLAVWLFLVLGLVVNPDGPVWVQFVNAFVVWCAIDICAKFYRIFVSGALAIRLSLLIASIGLPVVLAATTDLALNPHTHSTSTIWFTLSIAITATVVSYPYRFFAEVGQKLEKINHQTTSLVARVRREADEIRDSFSRFVHGKVQGRLALVSFVLGQIASGEVKGREKTKQIKLLVEMLDTIESEMLALSEPPKAKPLAESISRLEAEWAGLVSIELEMQPGLANWLESNPFIESQIFGLVEEAILNARIHGQATEVEVLLSFDENSGDRVVLRVRDNGIGLDPNRSSGLGSRQFSAVCESWQINRVDNHITQLEAIIGGDLE